MMSLNLGRDAQSALGACTSWLRHITKSVSLSLELKYLFLKLHTEFSGEHLKLLNFLDANIVSLHSFLKAVLCVCAHAGTHALGYEIISFISLPL